MKSLIVLAIGMMMSGCAVMPESHVRSWNLNDTHLIYFEQSDRVPRDVLIEAIKDSAKSNAVAKYGMAISPEIIAKVAEEIFKMIPELSKTYSNERMNEAMIGRRVLVKGYQGTNELTQVNEIIKSLSKCIEHWTPQADCVIEMKK
jgi:hypothetical protein